jgi:hypothetical protein
MKHNQSYIDIFATVNNIIDCDIEKYKNIDNNDFFGNIITISTFSLIILILYSNLFM